MGREIGKWKDTGKWARWETNTEHQFRVSPKFKTAKEAHSYMKPTTKDGKYTLFTPNDRPTKDPELADSLHYPNWDNLERGGKK